MDEELQALEAELAQLRAAVNAPATPTATPDMRPAVATGGLLNLGDILTFGQLSKGIAAVPAIGRDFYGLATGAEPQDYYSQELAKVNALKDLYAAERERQGLSGLETALSFMAPVPAGKAEALMSVARPLKEAGLGLAAYGGSELGEATIGGTGGAILGALAAPLTAQGAVGLGRRAVSTLDEPRALLRGDETAIQNAAVQEILDRAGPEGAARIAIAQELGTPLMSPLGVPMTAAEIAQTPSLATYQYAMSKPEMGGQTLLDALAKRKEEQALAFGALGTQPQKGQLSEALRTVAAQQGVLKADEAIKGIDLDLASRNPAAMEEPSRLVQSLGTEVISEIKTAAKDAKEAGRSAFKDPEVYNVTVDVPKIASDVNGLVKSWRRDPSQRIGDNRIVKAIKDLKELETKEADFLGVKSQARIGKLHDIQVELGRVISKGTSGERTQDQALALSLHGYIENVIAKAPGSEKLLDAKQKWKNYFDTFVYDRERGVISPLKQALKKSPEKVVPFLSSESASIGALKKAGVGAQQIETQKLSEFMNLPTAEKKLAWITKNRPALSEANFWPSIENAEQTLKATLEPGQLSEFAKVSEGQIPSQIFSDLGKARRFMKDVEGTQLEDLTRGKFIESLQTGRGTIADRLASQRDVAKTIFKGDYDQLEKVITDIEGAALPERLKQQATGKQSITAQAQTTLGTIFNKRALLRAAQNSKYVAGIVGSIVGGAGSGGILGAAVGGVLGEVTALRVGKKAAAVEEQLNAAINQMLSKPELIKFAAAPPTVKNVESFFEQASRLGYFGARGAQQAGKQAPVSPTATPTEDTEIADLEAELESLRQMLPKQEVKVGKQNISIPTGKQYAPASLVKAVMKVESGGKQEAVSSKGARGLMQLMPATARDLGVDAKDPKQNVEGGSRYLQQQLIEFGDESLALAAYNWGPNNIKRVMAKVRAEGKRPTWANIKAYVKVPKETREYVDKVLSLV